MVIISLGTCKLIPYQIVSNLSCVLEFKILVIRVMVVMVPYADIVYKCISITQIQELSNREEGVQEKLQTREEELKQVQRQLGVSLFGSAVYQVYNNFNFMFISIKGSLKVIPCKEKDKYTCTNVLPSHFALELELL